METTPKTGRENGISDRLFDNQQLSGMKIAGRLAIISLEGRAGGAVLAGYAGEGVSALDLVQTLPAGLAGAHGRGFPMAAVGVVPLALVFEEAAAREGCDGAALAGFLELLLACVPALALALPARVEAEVCP